jgi:BhlA holin family
VEPNWIVEIWQAAKTAGPFANMFLLLVLYLVNNERRDCQRKSEERFREMLTGLNEATESIRALSSLFQRRK